MKKKLSQENNTKLKSNTMFKKIILSWKFKKKKKYQAEKKIILSWKNNASSEIKTKLKEIILS